MKITEVSTTGLSNLYLHIRLLSYRVVPVELLEPHLIDGTLKDFHFPSGFSFGFHSRRT